MIQTLSVESLATITGGTGPEEMKSARPSLYGGLGDDVYERNARALQACRIDAAIPRGDGISAAEKKRMCEQAFYNATFGHFPTKQR